MAITARGAIARTPGAPVSIEEFTIDDPGPNEVLVRILASGVCHTDLGVKSGTYGTDGFPFLMGHEGAGIIEAVGPGVDESRVGEYVILAWRAPCGECRFCKAGRPNLCAASLNAEKRMRTTDGVTLTPVLGIGTFCTHTLVHGKQAVPVSPDLPASQMSLIGCGVMTGVGAALYSAGVRPGASAAVFGCGGVGDSVIQGAKLAGATTIIAADVVARKLEWARAFGATQVVDSSRTDLVAAAHAATGGIGVDHAFVCIDPPATLLPAFRATAKAGNVVVTALTPADELSLPVPPLELVTSQKAIMGSVYGFASPRVQIPELIALYRRGAIRLSELITRRYPLDAVNDGYADLIAGRNLRGVLLPFG